MCVVKVSVGGRSDYCALTLAMNYCSIFLLYKLASLMLSCFLVCHREIFEQGKRAFVSFVHFYYKHECKLIFQPKGNDIVCSNDRLSLIGCSICWCLY